MTVTKRNPALAALMKEAMKREDNMTVVDLVRVTGFNRGTIGAVVRGETQRVAPEVANVITKRLGIRMERFLRACGYDLPVRTRDELPDRLADVWPRVPQKVRAGVIELAELAASYDAQEGASSP